MEPELVWRCGDCGTTYTDEDEARMCCRPEVYEGWLCPECKTFHDTKGEAIDCCYESENGTLRPATHDELEAAGQQRLALGA